VISSHRRRRPGEEREINWPSRCQFRCYLDWQNHAELGCVRHPEFLHLAEMACLGVCKPLMTLSSEWPKRKASTECFACHAHQKEQDLSSTRSENDCQKAYQRGLRQ